ncbi:MAG: TonB family protein [Pseudomonadota bacterium]
MIDETTKQQPNRWKRTLAVAVPAGAMTLALFSAMHHLVAVDDFEPPVQRAYSVEALMAQETSKPVERPSRKVVKPKPIKAPPQPPKLIKSVNNAKVPLGTYTGGIPADYGEADFDSIKPKRASAIEFRTLEPLTPPIPVYPGSAASRGIEGSCEVYFSVSIRGEPFDVQADCTDRVFRSAAIKAVKKVKFAPKIHDGLPVTVNGVVYPLEFRMEP